ncbi:amidohydrolase family protein [Salinibacterium sp. SYSU T00001]|uniref:metal-dependent hydrolase family protein n=1 Tax=Homoserinimonas sedimenticola TaxID=2986805 RepID=UPI002235FF32|nr:amidohydrolase family protein [Salinibacterium sedimenticola]MCW4385937.1 amidohydrolase family protein [Salinibacterium sedimenticola]
MGARLPLTPQGHGEVRYVGATLIDGTGAAPIRDSEVEVHDDRITYAGPRRDAASDVRTVDLSGSILMPGFVDAHVHLAMVPGSSEEQRAWFPEEAAFAVAEQLRATVDAGVTTARDLDGLTPGYRNAIERGSIIGPRLHLAIAMLSPTGGHADPVMPNGSLPAWAVRLGMPTPGVVDTAEDVIRTVRALLRTGADAIKVCTSGGVGSPTDEPEDAGLPEEHVRLITEILGGRGDKPVTSHALTDAGVRTAVLGGVASIEHGYDLSDETIALMVERGTVLVPTLSTLMRTLPPSAPPSRVEERAILQRRGLDSVRRAIAAGVRVALGTDAGVHPHGRNLRELAWLVEAGLSPLEAIRAGTLEGARLLGLDENLGSIEPGKLADLVVSSCDPLTEIERMVEPGSIRMVVQSGRMLVDLDRRAD